ncbi:MAG: BamA/TamA family outer membrane protein, partial [Gemmatimonadota bacterium]
EFFHRERDNEVYEYRETSDEVTLQFLGNLTERFHVGPRIAYIRLGSEADSLGVRPPVILDPDHTDDIPAAGLVAEFDTRNLLNYPTSGWYFVVSAMQNGGPLGGSVDYGRLEVDVRRYVEITGPRHSLAFYSLFGLTSGDVGVDVPLHQEFSLGGTNSVRGWPIGSRTGKNEWINTAEYWWNILPASAFRFWFVHWSMGLQLAAFADAGTAWNTDREFSRSWIGGGGLGARLTVPQVGLVRFDVALGEDRPDFSLSLHIGGNEKAVAQRRRVR